MRQLDRSDQQRLLGIARAAIEAAVCPGPHPALDPSMLTPAVQEPAAAFVTLHEGGELRGCIGLLRHEVPVWMNVRDAAAAAALDDPRFMPVGAAEVPALELEVSVLEPAVELPDPAGFQVGRHGIVVERGPRRALLLPQVATEQGWGPEEMLDAVCRKAGLPTDAWRDRGTKLYVFEAACFGEAAEEAVREPGSGAAT
jgi:AmmeMemoRadiSam system protein A